MWSKRRKNVTDEELDTLARKHRMRGSILRAACGLIKTAEDRSVHVTSFRRILGEMATLPEVQQQADYLVAAGYLERTLDKRAARDTGTVTGYRPTIKGIQLVEGDLEDPAVEFFSL